MQNVEAAIFHVVKVEVLRLQKKKNKDHKTSPYNSYSISKVFWSHTKALCELSICQGKIVDLKIIIYSLGYHLQKSAA